MEADLTKLPPLAEPRPLPKCRSRFPAALKRAAEAVDEAQLRFAEDPLRFEEAFEDAKQRFVDVYEAMSEEKQRALRYAAICVNMKTLWGDNVHYPRRTVPQHLASETAPTQFRGMRPTPAQPKKPANRKDVIARRPKSERDVLEINAEHATKSTKVIRADLADERVLTFKKMAREMKQRGWGQERSIEAIKSLCRLVPSKDTTDGKARLYLNPEYPHKPLRAS
jgi:hypothetical protein